MLKVGDLVEHTQHPDGVSPVYFGTGIVIGIIPPRRPDKHSPPFTTCVVFWFTPPRGYSTDKVYHPYSVLRKIEKQNV